MKWFTKTFALTLVLLFTGSVAYAQILPLSLEVRAGSNLSNMSIKDIDTKAKAGFNGGLALQLSVPLTGLFVESGVFFTSKGAKLNETFMGVQNKTTINANYLQVPVLVGFKLSALPLLRIKFYAGPYFAQGIGGKTGNLDTFRGDGLQRFDSGITAGAGAELFKFTLNLGVEYGWTNVSHTDVRMRNQNSFITLGYKIF